MRLAFLFLMLACSVIRAETEQPNFLIILGDDISASSLGCYGSENPHTSPHIDALAKEGVRFTNMFVSEAICAPTRAELYTGLQPHRNGCSRNHQATRNGTLSVVQHLSKLGYRVGLTGKTHIKPRSVYPFEVVPGFPKNCNARELKEANWEGVSEFMTRDSEQPFCLFICSVHAHSPWDSGDVSPWELADLKLPAHFADTVKTRELFREYLAEVRLFDNQIGKAQALLKEQGLEENTALIVLDENGAGMPCGKWTNFDWGVRSACVMKWPKSFAKGGEVDALAQYCDILPTLIDAAGGEVSKDFDGKSLLPCLRGETQEHREKAFFVYNSGSEGVAFTSRAVAGGQFKLMWNLTPDSLFTVRTINGFDYGYVDKMKDRHVRQLYRSWLEKTDEDSVAKAAVQRYRKHPEFQLYDLKADPWEMTNLAEDSQYEEKLTELKAAIVAWMEQQGDKVGLSAAGFSVE